MSDLKTRYDLGVGPMREALSQLVSERLVTPVPIIKEVLRERGLV